MARKWYITTTTHRYGVPTDDKHEVTFGVWLKHKLIIWSMVLVFLGILFAVLFGELSRYIVWIRAAWS